MKPLNIAILYLALLAYPAAVWAHAFLDHSEPKVGSEITQPPTEVKIWFTMGIKPESSEIKVYGADDKQVDKKDSHVDAHDKTLLIVSLPKLPSGTYKVSWDVYCTDGHQTSDDFTFTVKAAH
jgi:methionine-rich copper-binding protein CopC